MKQKRNILITIAILLSGLCAQAQPQQWEWKEIGRGVQYGTMSLRLFDSDQTISAVRFVMSKSHTELVNDPGRTAETGSATISGFGERYDAIAALNGSYFNTRTLYPTTYIRDDGEAEGTLEQSEMTRVDGSFIIRGRKCKVVPFSDSTAYRRELRKAREIMESGPVLIYRGETRGEWPTGDDFFDRRHPRSIAGIGSDGYVYFIVIDGRHRGHADGTTIPETAAVAGMFGLKDAINLDGGGSSALWVKGVGVISHPCDNHRFDNLGERKVPNALILK